MHFTMYLNGLLLCILLGISMGYCYAFDCVAQWVTVMHLTMSQWVTVMHFTMYLNGLLLCILLGISMGYCYAFYYVSQWVTVMHLDQWVTVMHFTIVD